MKDSSQVDNPSEEFSFPELSLICTFCLNPIENGINLHPEALKSSQSHIWQYLVGEGPKNKWNDEEVGRGIPPLCDPCKDKAMALEGLHSKLISLVKELNGILQNSERNSKLQEIERQLEGCYGSSIGHNNRIKTTLEFLKCLGGNCFEAVAADDGADPDGATTTISQSSYMKANAQTQTKTEWKLDLQTKVVLDRVCIDSNSISTGFQNEDERCEELTIGTVVKQEIDADNADPMFTLDWEMDPVESLALTDQIKEEEQQKIRRGRGRPKKKNPVESLISKRKKRRANNIFTRPKGKKVAYALQICELCGDKFRLSEIEEHMRSHVGDYVVNCPNPQCLYTFSNWNTMVKTHLFKKRHKRCNKIFSETGFTCETCGQKFSSKEGQTFRSHLSRHETGLKSFDCPFSPDCKERFTIQQNVHAHIYKRHRFIRQQQMCQICQKYFSCSNDDDNGMTKHLQDIHGAPEVIQCPSCQFTFMSHEDVIVHMRDHGGDGKLACGICANGAKFHAYIHLVEHYFKEHGIGKEYVCEQCGKSFLSLQSLRQHVLVVHEGMKIFNKYTYKCEECGDDKVYQKEKELVAHKIKFHGAEPYICEICTLTFPSLDALKHHDRQKHGVEKGFVEAKTFPCEVEGCDKVYKGRRGLQKHHKSFHEAQPGPKTRYQCTICFKDYATPHGVQRHKRLVHEKIRRDFCEICGESFSTPHNLKIHKLIHTGERPFSCEICGQAFRQKCILQTHLNSHQTQGDNFKPKGPIERKKRFKRESTFFKL